MAGSAGGRKRVWFAFGLYEKRLTIAGLVLGMLLGLGIGGVGIAARGSAIGLPACVVFGVLLAMVGNRLGVAFDRPRS